MEKEINMFLKSLKADGKSNCTISSYKGDLVHFAADMVEIGKCLPEVKYVDLRNWADGLAEDGLSSTSRARKISSVRSFFRYCKKMGLTADNPADGLDFPKIERKQPVTISIEDAKNVLQEAKKCHYGDSGVTWFRNYTILSVFLNTGVRREELINIKMDDVDLSNMAILIHGKGSKQRYVYINDSLLPILSEYLKKYRGLFNTAETSNYLFPSTMSEKMCLKTVNNVVNNAFLKAGIKEPKRSTHSLRKRFATSVFQYTRDIAVTSKLLGHSSPTVTMRYVVIGEETMRSATKSVNF